MNDLKDIKDQIKTTLGQINAISNMIEKDDDCVKIAEQILAAREGLSKAGRDLLVLEYRECSKEKNSKIRIKKFENLVKNFFKMS